MIFSFDCGKTSTQATARSSFPDMHCESGNICDNYADPVAICQGCADRGLPCTQGLECCWGNHFNLNQGIAVSKVQERWYAVDTIIQANSVFSGLGNADGEMALWIDGELVAHHTHRGHRSYGLRGWI